MLWYYILSFELFLNNPGVNIMGENGQEKSISKNGFSGINFS